MGSDFTITVDLFIGVFICTIVAYSFIIGINGILRIILSSYLALLSADGLGIFVQNHLIGISPILTKLSFVMNGEFIAIFKILIFISTIVICTIRGAFLIDLPTEKSVPIKMIITGFLGFVSGNLILSVLLMYISGGSFLQHTLNTDLSLLSIYKQSQLAQAIINHFYLSFFLPVASFIGLSFVYNKD